MTDTPAVVSLIFGLVLKCFFIFPATDNWWSFSHRPSSWVRNEKVRVREKDQSLWKNCSFNRFYSTLHLQWPKGAPGPGELCTSGPPPPPAWIWSAPSAGKQTADQFNSPDYKKRENTVGLCKSKYSPWQSLTHCPSTAGGTQAVPSVSDRKALLDLHCSCKQNKLLLWLGVPTYYYYIRQSSEKPVKL